MWVKVGIAKSRVGVSWDVQLLVLRTLEGRGGEDKSMLPSKSNIYCSLIRIAACNFRCFILEMGGIYFEISNLLRGGGVTCQTCPRDFPRWVDQTRPVYMNFKVKKIRQNLKHPTILPQNNYLYINYIKFFSCLTLYFITNLHFFHVDISTSPFWSEMVNFLSNIGSAS
jgi:hypothetical protein